VTASQPITSELISGLSAISRWDARWFAVQTRPRYERKVAFDLQEKGIKSFVPLYSAKNQWSDRRQTISIPLFPGYAFVHIPSGQGIRIAILRTGGVMSFVGSKGLGTPIPDSEIEAVQTILEQRIPFSLHPYTSIGQVVRIRGGALEGVRGLLTKVNDDQSLIISVELIQRSVAMRITGYDIEPA
jgi:transcription antitermination factor NusG